MNMMRNMKLWILLFFFHRHDSTFFIFIFFFIFCFLFFLFAIIPFVFVCTHLSNIFMHIGRCNGFAATFICESVCIFSTMCNGNDGKKEEQRLKDRERTFAASQTRFNSQTYSSRMKHRLVDYSFHFFLFFSVIIFISYCCYRFCSYLCQLVEFTNIAKQQHQF